MRLQAIVFDFDGVIADTEPLHLEALQQALGTRGISLGRDEYYHRYLGHDDVTLLAMLLGDRGLAMGEEDRRALLDDKARRYRTLIAGAPPLMPGAADRLRAWSAGLPLAIASGALREEIEAILAAAGVASCVRVIVASGDAPRGKPAPDPYRLAIERLGTLGRRPLSGRSPVGQPLSDWPSSDDSSAAIEPARCVAIEDSRLGIESARAAGLKVIAVGSTSPRSVLVGADLVTAGVADLDLDQIERLVGEVARTGGAGR